jgi:hypothetical protein
MTLKTKIKNHVVTRKGITEFEAFVRYGLTPTRLKNTINELRMDGFVFTANHDWADCEYRIMEYNA